YLGAVANATSTYALIRTRSLHLKPRGLRGQRDVQLAAGEEVCVGELECIERLTVEGDGLGVTSDCRIEAGRGDRECATGGKRGGYALKEWRGELVARGAFGGARGAKEADGDEHVPGAHDALVFVAAPSVFGCVSGLNRVDNPAEPELGAVGAAGELKEVRGGEGGLV